MAKKKFYAVRKGTTTGIFNTWAECEEAVKGVSCAQYKSFSTMREAEMYLSDETEGKSIYDEKKEEKVDEENFIKAYVDGSFDESLNRYSYGLIMIFPDGSKKEYSDFREHNPDTDSRNVSGELLGAEIAIREAVEQGYDEILVFHDYEGIAKWAKGEWRANKLSSIKYTDFIKEFSSKIKIYFKWVKGHSGDEYNELADRLAKNALRADQNKTKLGDNNLVVDNLKVEDIDAIMELIDEDEDYSVHIRRKEDSNKTIWQLLMGAEKLTAVHYTKTRKFVIQGKPETLFSILSSFILELVDSNQIVEVINSVYEIEVDKEIVEHKYNTYLPNKNIEFSPKLDNTFKQAIYNLQMDGDMYDHTYLSFPALRGLEGFMKLILSKHKINCEESFHCFIRKDPINKTYKLDEKYHSNIGSPKKIQYLNKIYDYYRKHRNTLFHWDPVKPREHDSTRILSDKHWRINITDTLALVDDYFTTS